MSNVACIYCTKECKSSDSRPYPSSKSKDRIHNKCQIKKKLADKGLSSSSKTSRVSNDVTTEKPTAAVSVMQRIAREESEIKRAANERELMKLVEGRSSQSANDNGSFFFDLKAGVAKPHEKRRYLHHRNLREIAVSHDDEGFQYESAGRAYDHTGKDLNSLDDCESEDNDEKDQAPKRAGRNYESKGSKKRYLDSGDQQSKHGKAAPKVKLDERNPCWFCLSSPNVEKHLIIAIGEFCYLTLAKGALTDEHFLLIPIEHIQSLTSDLNSKELLEELERFKKSLVDYFGRQSKGVVFFERNFRSVHWQLQVVPIELDLIDTLEGNIELITKRHFKNADYLNIPSSCSISDVILPNAPYFYWQIEPTGSRFVTQIQVQGSFFPVQLGRLVLADPDLLNCMDKVDWKRCSKSKEEYTNEVRVIKERYEEFNIT